MLDDKGNKMRYSNRQKLKETKQLKYRNLLYNYKKREGIKGIENNYNMNSKTCNLAEFKIYIILKNIKNQLLYKKYENPKFRQYKWYAYINKKRSRDRLLTRIEKKFGKESKIIYGDWGEKTNHKQMRNFISTPQIGLKRKIKERFEIYNIDEFRTSCLHHKTEERCGNLCLPDKKGKSRNIHSILTYKMENNRYGCINRDWNAVKNMKKITEYWFKHKMRPYKYRRSTNLKASNPNKSNLLVSNRGKPNDNSEKSLGCIYSTVFQNSGGVPFSKKQQ